MESTAWGQPKAPSLGICNAHMQIEAENRTAPWCQPYKEGAGDVTAQDVGGISFLSLPN